MLNYPEYCWIDVAAGGVEKRNNVIDVRKWSVLPGTSEVYRTVYRYPNAFKEHFIAEHSVGGYKGAVYADYLPIDIDELDLVKAQKSATALLERLLMNYDVELSYLHCSFSGAKGFHVMIPVRMFNAEPSQYLPRVFKLMVAEICEGMKYDPAIYDTVRLFRVIQSINIKSGLHKIPLTPAEIMHLEITAIQELAKTPRLDFVYIREKIDAIPPLVELYKRCLKKITSPLTTVKLGTIDPPINAKLCYYKLLEGVSQGNRDASGLRLSIYFRKQGLPTDIIYSIMQAWNKRNSPPLDTEDIDKLVRQSENAYDFGCKDELLAEHCNKRCRYNKQTEDKAQQVYTIEDAQKRYEDYVVNIDKRRVKVHIAKIDKAIRGIAPGEVLQILARSGVGKTGFLINVAREVSTKQEIPTLFVTMEQPLAQIYERTAQVAFEIQGEEVERNFRERTPNLANIIHKTKEQFKNVYFVDQDFLDYENLKDYIIASKQKIGKMPALVAVDYLGRMKGHGNQYEALSELAKQLKRLAKELDVAIMCVHQTNRLGKTGAEPITMDMARGSGEIEEAADFVLGLWRPDCMKEESHLERYERICVAVLKNRKGPLTQTELIFDKHTLTIKAMKPAFEEQKAIERTEKQAQIWGEVVEGYEDIPF